MAERPTGRRPAWGLRLSALLAALPIVGLGLASSHGIWVGLGVAAAGLFVTLALTVPKSVAGRRWAPVPTTLAAGILAVNATLSPAAELLAGASALLCLVLVSQTSVDPHPISESLPSLGLPTLALAVALGSTIALPTIPNQVGAAGALLVVVFLLLAWLFSRTERVSPSAPPPS